jgi:hypothetical protein
MRVPRLAGLAVLIVIGLLTTVPITAQAQPDSVRLRWTAPGDDANIGTASAYSLRWSLSPIDAGNWASATEVVSPPAPLPAGGVHTFTVRGLTFGTPYYFALRTVDEAGNWSALSNVLLWNWVYDTAPPSAPAGVSAGLQSPDVRVRWNPNTEPDLAGYSVYRSTTSGSGFVRISPTLVGSAEFVDSNLPPGVDRLYYQVTATDESGNESSRSAQAMALLVAAGSWALESPYPNPSSGPVNFPITVPAEGPGSARLDILTPAGHRVRSIELATLLPGAQLVTWDGRNDSGEPVAPGVYRGRVKTGGTDRWVRLVRVP